MNLDDILNDFHQYGLQKTEECLQKNEIHIQWFREYAKNALASLGAKTRWLPKTPKVKRKKKSISKAKPSLARAKVQPDEEEPSTSGAPRRTRRGTTIKNDSDVTATDKTLPKRSARLNSAKPSDELETTVRKSKRVVGRSTRVANASRNRTSDSSDNSSSAERSQKSQLRNRSLKPATVSRNEAKNSTEEEGGNSKIRESPLKAKFSVPPIPEFKKSVASKKVGNKSNVSLNPPPSSASSELLAVHVNQDQSSENSNGTLPNLSSCASSNRGTFIRNANVFETAIPVVNKAGDKARTPRNTFVDISNTPELGLRKLSIVLHKLSAEVVEAAETSGLSASVNKDDSVVVNNPSTTQPNIVISEPRRTSKRKASEALEDSCIIIESGDDVTPFKIPSKSVLAAPKAAIKLELCSPALVLESDSSFEEFQVNRTPMRLISLQDPKRPFLSRVTSSPRAPESPKQLFSAYSKGGIKKRAEAFENFVKEQEVKKTPVKNIPTVVLETPPSSLKNPRRTSLRKSNVSTNNCILAKVQRMSTSGRRSSLARFRVRASINQCLKRVSNQLMVHEESRLDNSKSETEPSTSNRQLDVPTDRQLEKQPEAEPSVAASPMSDEEWLDESPQKGHSPCPKQLGSTGVVPKTFQKSSAFYGLKKCSIEKSFSNWTSRAALSAAASSLISRMSGGQKSAANTTQAKATYPGSETRQFQKSHVAALAMFYDKGSANRNASSCGRTQGSSRLGATAQATLMANSVKNFQRPSYAITSKTRAAMLMEEVEKKKAKEEEVLRKRQELMKQRTEETRRKCEEKHQRVRENRIRNDSENKRRTLELQEQAQALLKRNQEILKAKVEAKRLKRLQREAEIEKRRKEEEKARLAKLREEQYEAQRLQELAIKKQQQQQQQQKVTAATVTTSAAHKSIPKAAPVAQNLNETFDVNNATFSANQSDPNNYDMTPHRSELPKEELKEANNYNIDDLNSDDETDEEGDPKKKIPDWAQGISLRMAAWNQFRNPIDENTLFSMQFSCNLEEMFDVQRSRFKQRTSSAVWNHPPKL